MGQIRIERSGGWSRLRRVGARRGSFLRPPSAARVLGGAERAGGAFSEDSAGQDDSRFGGPGGATFASSGQFKCAGCGVRLGPTGSEGQETVASCDAVNPESGLPCEALLCSSCGKADVNGLSECPEHAGAGLEA